MCDAGEQIILRPGGDPGLLQCLRGFGDQLPPATALFLCHGEAVEGSARGEQKIRRQLRGVLRSRIETLG